MEKSEKCILIQRQLYEARNALLNARREVIFQSERVAELNSQLAYLNCSSLEEGIFGSSTEF